MTDPKTMTVTFQGVPVTFTADGTHVSVDIGNYDPGADRSVPADPRFATLSLSVSIAGDNGRPQASPSGYPADGGRLHFDVFPAPDAR